MIISVSQRVAREENRALYCWWMICVFEEFVCDTNFFISLRGVESVNRWGS